MYLSAKTQSDVDTHPAATLAVVGSHKPTRAKESFTMQPDERQLHGFP